MDCTITTVSNELLSNIKAGPNVFLNGRKVFLVGEHTQEVKNTLGIYVQYISVPTIDEAITSRSCTNGALIILPEKVGNDEITIAALLLYRGDQRFIRGNQPTDSQVESLFEIRSHGGLGKVMTNMPHQVQIGILISYLEGMV